MNPFNYIHNRINSIVLFLLMTHVQVSWQITIRTELTHVHEMQYNLYQWSSNSYHK